MLLTLLNPFIFIFMAAITAQNIISRETLAEWLQALPAELILHVAVVIAARSAHRAIPLALSRREHVDFKDTLIFLQALRSNLIARTAGKLPIAQLVEPARSAAQDLAALSGKKPLMRISSPYAAVSVVATSTNDYAVAQAASAAHAASQTAAGTVLNTSRTFWKAVQNDAVFIEGFKRPIQLQTMPLWVKKVPDWLDRKDSSVWRKLSNGEFQSSQFHVWQDWYDSIVEGKPAFDLPKNIANDVELRIALGDNQKNFWNREPALINAEISVWVNEARARTSKRPHLEIEPTINDIPDITHLLNPNPAVTQFEQGMHGKITIVPDFPSPSPTRQISELEELYHEGREKAQALLLLGQNRLGGCFEPAKALVEHLTQDYKQISINRVWSKTNTLRGILLQHVQEREKDLNIRDTSVILESETAVKLQDCVSQLNIFISFDARGRELDRLSFGPEARSKSEAVISAVTPIIVNMGSVAEGATVTVVMGDHNGVASSSHNIHGDQAVERIARVRTH